MQLPIPTYPRLLPNVMAMRVANRYKLAALACHAACASDMDEGAEVFGEGFFVFRMRPSSCRSSLPLVLRSKLGEKLASLLSTPVWVVWGLIGNEVDYRRHSFVFLVALSCLPRLD